MPDTFPGKGFTDDSDKLVDYTLNHMQEGQIGKILVRKSGKIEVIIGNVPYLIDVEENPEFFEVQIHMFKIMPLFLLYSSKSWCYQKNLAKINPLPLVLWVL